MASNYDAIIIGGGPAGSVAALELTRMAWRVLLIEKGRRHREKACGHCLSARGVSMLESLGLGCTVDQIARGSTSVLRLHALNLPAIDVPLHPSADTDARAGRHRQRLSGAVVRRCDLDQLLLDAAAAAGATIVQPAMAKVESLAPGKVNVTVRHRDQAAARDGCAAAHGATAPLIIGADGLGSRVARDAALTPRPQCKQRRYGFSVTLDHAIGMHFEHDTIHMFATHGGYLGAVSQGAGMLHVATLVRTDHERAVSPRSFLDQISRCTADIGRIAQAAAGCTRFLAAGPMPWRASDVANSYVALLGDAAGYAEPFTGEGMTWAIESALLLARTLRDVAPGTWNRHLASSYSRAWRQAIEPRLRRCDLIARILERPVLLAAAVRISRPWPAFPRRIVRRVVAA